MISLNHINKTCAGDAAVFVVPGGNPPGSTPLRFGPPLRHTGSQVPPRGVGHVGADQTGLGEAKTAMWNRGGDVTRRKEGLPAYERVEGERNGFQR